MKYSRLPLIILFGSTCLADEFEQKVKKINSDFESILDDARETKEPKQKDAKFEIMREYAEAWYPFSFLYTVNGSDELQEELTKKILVDAVYTAFTAEQSHYTRTIIHTDGNDERARTLMGLRAESICRIYPIGDRQTITEDFYFAQIMLPIYMEAPDATCEAIKKNLPRWQGEERIVALLILADHGSEAAKDELKRFDTERSKKLSTLARVFWEYKRRKPEPAGADQPATNPADKAPVKGETSTPTPEDVPR